MILFLTRFLICATLLLGACSPEFRHAKKIERAKDKITRIVNKYPELLIAHSDTSVKVITRTDTLFTEKIDTLYTNKFYYDTLYKLTQGKGTTTVKIERDTIRITLSVEPDTLILRDTLRVEFIRDCPEINIAPNYGIRALAWVQRSFGVAGIFLILLVIIGGIGYIVKTYLRL